MKLTLMGENSFNVIPLLSLVATTLSSGTGVPPPPSSESDAASPAAFSELIRFLRALFAGSLSYPGSDSPLPLPPSPPFFFSSVVTDAFRGGGGGAGGGGGGGAGSGVATSSVCCFFFEDDETTDFVKRPPKRRLRALLAGFFDSLACLISGDRGEGEGCDCGVGVGSETGCWERASCVGREDGCEKSTFDFAPPDCNDVAGLLTIT